MLKNGVKKNYTAEEKVQYILDSVGKMKKFVANG